MTEYRQNDETQGYCPLCREPLGHLTVGLTGFCELHGWQPADFRSDRDPGDETEPPPTASGPAESGDD